MHGRYPRLSALPTGICGCVLDFELLAFDSTVLWDFGKTLSFSDPSGVLSFRPRGLQDCLLQKAILGPLRF